MKTHTLLLLLLSPILFTTLHAQKAVKKYYQNQIAEGEIFLGGTMQHLFLKTADGQFVQKVYYPEKKALTHYITYKGIDFQEIAGPYKEWYDDGRLWKEGQYKDGKKDGIWSIYPFDKKGKTEQGAYTNGKREGQWIEIDSLGNTIKESNYQAGKLHGITKIYNKKGELSIQRLYAQGALVKEEGFPTSIPTDTAKTVELMPMMKGCMDEELKARKICSDRTLLESIYRNIRYPNWARKNAIEGTAIFSFVITKDGSMMEIKTLRGLCEDIEAESKRVISSLPEWNPGRQNGQAVRVQFNLPIKYRLE